MKFLGFFISGVWMIFFRIRHNQVLERIVQYISNAFLEVLQPCASRLLCYWLKCWCIRDVFWHFGLLWIVKNVLSQPKGPIVLLTFYSPEGRMGIKINCSTNRLSPLEYHSLICAFFGWLCFVSTILTLAMNFVNII